MRMNCIKVPSVPVNFMRLRQKINDKEKLTRMMNGNTRRMMTYLRISENII